MRQLWLKSLGKSQVSSWMHVCSKHFLESDFKETVLGDRKILKPNAVPVNVVRSEVKYI